MLLVKIVIVLICVGLPFLYTPDFTSWVAGNLGYNVLVRFLERFGFKEQKMIESILKAIAKIVPSLIILVVAASLFGWLGSIRTGVQELRGSTTDQATQPAPQSPPPASVPGRIQSLPPVASNVEIEDMPAPKDRHIHIGRTSPSAAKSVPASSPSPDQSPLVAVPVPSQPAPEPTNKTTGDCSPIVSGAFASSNPDCSKTYVAPPQRTISPDIAASISQALKALGPREIVVKVSGPGGAEAQQYAKEWLQILTKADWKPMQINWLDAGAIRGVNVVISANDVNTPPQIADLFVNAINNSGIHATPMAMYPPAGPPSGTFLLLIGAQ